VDSPGAEDAVSTGSTSSIAGAVVDEARAVGAARSLGSLLVVEPDSSATDPDALDCANNAAATRPSIDMAPARMPISTRFLTFTVRTTSSPQLNHIGFIRGDAV